MKDRSESLRRIGRGRHNSRVLRGNRQRLQDVWSLNGGAMREPVNRKAQARALYQARLDTNWRVKIISPNRVLALEPGREFENVFEGGTDPFWDAVTFAASEIRKGSDEQQRNAQAA